MQIKLYINQMHCPSCEILIEQEIKKINGVEKAKASLKSKSVDVIYNTLDQNELLNKINEKINKYNYTANLENTKRTKNTNDLYKAALISLAVITIYTLLQFSGILNNFNIQSNSLPAVFFIGVIASLSSCAAVVGGLILSLSATLEKEKAYSDKTIWLFHIARLVSFFILGGIIGLLGKSIPFNPVSAATMNILLAFVMIILGINLIDIFDFSKKLQIRMPSFLSKKMIEKSESSKYSSVFLGVATFFLPCGFTQSMQMYALSTQDFLEAGLTMFVFALGTFPILFLISVSSKSFSKSKYANLFFKVTGILVVAFGLFNLYNALVVAQLIG